MHTFYSSNHTLHDPARLHRGDDARWNNYYAEVAARGLVIHEAVSRLNLGPIVAPRDFGHEILQSIHTPQLLDCLQNAYKKINEESGRHVALPDTFWPGSHTRPQHPSIYGQLGLFCFDTSSPIFIDTWDAAYWSAQTAVSAAAHVFENEATLAYALCRPPGHHAAADLYGGFCYLNNAALAAKWLVQRGQRVAVLDVDYHHGNGTQEIFYGRSDVLFISIHADPAFEYPYYWGYAAESGAGAGAGYNYNFPLPAGTTGEDYFPVLAQAIGQIQAFAPDSLIISLGVDTGAMDPTGTFLLDTPAFKSMGQQIGRLKRPTVLVQEGGYLLETLGNYVTAFLQGVSEGQS